LSTVSRPVLGVEVLETTTWPSLTNNAGFTQQIVSLKIARSPTVKSQTLRNLASPTNTSGPVAGTGTAMER